jgi:hypothetical protein
MSTELKQCVLNLWAKGWELKDITDMILIILQTSLCRWRAIFEDHNSVTKPPSATLGPARTPLTRAVLTASHTVYTQAAADLISVLTNLCSGPLSTIISRF